MARHVSSRLRETAKVTSGAVHFLVPSLSRTCRRRHGGPETLPARGQRGEKEDPAPVTSYIFPLSC